MEEIGVAGLRVGFRRACSGPPVVLLHGGFGFDSRSWRPQLEALADEFTVVAWDAPGAGQSSDPPTDFRMPEYADCLAGFIAALGLDRPHIVGLSWGAALAMQLYGRHPAIPRTLVLAGAYAAGPGRFPPTLLSSVSADYWTNSCGRRRNGRAPTYPGCSPRQHQGDGRQRFCPHVRRSSDGQPGDAPRHG